MIYPWWSSLTPDALTGCPEFADSLDSLVEVWFDVAGRAVHGWQATPQTGLRLQGGVAIIPGLGLPQYTFPTAAALAARGLPCTVLDLPGFGSGRLDGTRSHVHAVGRASAEWIVAQPPGAVTVLLGHSTGAQAALTAALAVQEVRRDLGSRPRRSHLRPAAAPVPAPRGRHPHGIPPRLAPRAGHCPLAGQGPSRRRRHPALRDAGRPRRPGPAAGPAAHPDGG